MTSDCETSMIQSTALLVFCPLVLALTIPQWAAEDLRLEPEEEDLRPSQRSSTDPALERGEQDHDMNEIYGLSSEAWGPRRDSDKQKGFQLSLSFGQDKNKGKDKDEDIDSISVDMAWDKTLLNTFFRNMYDLMTTLEDMYHPDEQDFDDD